MYVVRRTIIEDEISVVSYTSQLYRDAKDKFKTWCHEFPLNTIVFEDTTAGVELRNRRGEVINYVG